MDDVAVGRGIPASPEALVAAEAGAAQVWRVILMMVLVLVLILLLFIVRGEEVGED